jgi:hypothetical protein
LVVTLGMIVFSELVESSPKRAFAKQDQLCEALLFGRPNPTFCKCIQVRRSGR